MRFDVISIGDLDDGLVAVWQNLQSASDDLCSPFFGPEFAQLVGRCRSDVFVGIIEQEGTPCGFLPFHRKLGTAGIPIGGQVCDYQGIIGAQPAQHEMPAMLRGFGLASYDFNHALSTQKAFSSNSFWQSSSPRADLRNGYDMWKDEVSRSSKFLKTLARKARKIEREIGALRFVEHDRFEGSWETFVQWQDAAMRRRGSCGFSAVKWVNQLVSEIREEQRPGLQGRFSTLYAGDKLVAAHFGMRNERGHHWWFPTYDAELSTFSPGLLLLHHCIAAAANAGIDEFDFGRGDERYKTEFSNLRRPLCEGSFERVNTSMGALRAGRKATLSLAKKILPERNADIFRRGSTKILKAGLL